VNVPLQNSDSRVSDVRIGATTMAGQANHNVIGHRLHSQDPLRRSLGDRLLVESRSEASKRHDTVVDRHTDVRRFNARLILQLLEHVELKARIGPHYRSHGILLPLWGRNTLLEATCDFSAYTEISEAARSRERR
jgi:hypothetical protein